jgi:hypothetical protein
MDYWTQRDLGSLPAQPQKWTSPNPNYQTHGPEYLTKEPDQYLKNTTKKPNTPKRTTIGSQYELHRRYHSSFALYLPLPSNGRRIVVYFAVFAKKRVYMPQWIKINPY